MERYYNYHNQLSNPQNSRQRVCGILFSLQNARLAFSLGRVECSIGQALQMDLTNQVT